MATDSIDIYDELSKLRAFFREVAELTKEHDVLNDNAVVYPNKLGEALERVDPNWARGVTEDSLPRTVQCKQCLGIMNEGNGCALPECPIGVALPSQAALDSPSVEFPRSIKTPEERRAFIMGVAAGSLGAGKIDVDDIAWATGKDGVTGTFNEQEKGLAARPTSRGDLLEIEPNDRRPEESHRGTGEKEQRGGKAGRCDATRAGSAELGTRGGDAAPHEVAQDGGTGNGAAHGAAEDFSPCAICESPELCKQEGCSSAEWKRTHGVRVDDIHAHEMGLSAQLENGGKVWGTLSTDDKFLCFKLYSPTGHATLIAMSDEALAAMVAIHQKLRTDGVPAAHGGQHDGS